MKTVWVQRGECWFEIWLPLLNIQIFLPKEFFLGENLGKTENNIISAEAEKVTMVYY